MTLENTKKCFFIFIIFLKYILEYILQSFFLIITNTKKKIKTHIIPDHSKKLQLRAYKVLHFNEDFLNVFEKWN